MLQFLSFPYFLLYISLTRKRGKYPLTRQTLHVMVTKTRRSRPPTSSGLRVPLSAIWPTLQRGNGATAGRFDDEPSSRLPYRLLSASCRQPRSLRPAPS